MNCGFNLNFLKKRYRGLEEFLARSIDRQQVSQDASADPLQNDGSLSTHGTTRYSKGLFNPAPNQTDGQISGGPSIRYSIGLMENSTAM